MTDNVERAAVNHHLIPLEDLIDVLRSERGGTKYRKQIEVAISAVRAIRALSPSPDSGEVDADEEEQPTPVQVVELFIDMERDTHQEGNRAERDPTMTEDEYSRWMVNTLELVKKRLQALAGPKP